MTLGAREVAFMAFEATRNSPRRSVLWIVTSPRGIVIWDLLAPGEEPTQSRSLWTRCGDLSGVEQVSTIVLRLESIVGASRSLPA